MLAFLTGSHIASCPAGQRQKFALNSSDQVFHELRDLSFAAVGPELGKRTKGLRTDYQGTKGPDRRYAGFIPDKQATAFLSASETVDHIYITLLI